MDALLDIFRDYTLRNVALGCMILGAVSGVLGSFAVLRRQGLMGDALAHAALPGVCVAYMLTGEKTPIVLMVGAALSGWAAMGLILVAIRRLNVDSGTALGVILTSFFGLGVVMLSVISKGQNAAQAGLDKFLFGQAAALVTESVVTMIVLGGIAVCIVAILFKEFKLITFDPDFSHSIGLPPHRLGTLLTGLLVVAIVIGLNAVGVILMSAMLVAPAAAARQWTDSLAKMVWLSAGIGTVAGFAGAFAAMADAKLPTGPVVIIALGFITVVSLFFGSARGLSWSYRQARRSRAAMLREGAR